MGYPPLEKLHGKMNVNKNEKAYRNRRCTRMASQKIDYTYWRTCPPDVAGVESIRKTCSSINVLFIEQIPP